MAWMFGIQSRGKHTANKAMRLRELFIGSATKTCYTQDCRMHGFMCTTGMPIHFKEASTEFLRSHARTLLWELTNRENSKYRPTVFVASCYGGLLLAETLNYAHLPINKCEDILQSTIGIIFLGTPFRDSNKLALAGAQLRILVASYFVTDNSGHLLQVLDRETDRLNDMIDMFERLIHSKNISIPVTCFFENQKTDISKAIPYLPESLRTIVQTKSSVVLVDEDSACLQGVERQALDANHSLLNKYRGPRERNFRMVVSKIKGYFDERRGIGIESNDVLRVSSINSRSRHPSPIGLLNVDSSEAHRSQSRIAEAPRTSDEGKEVLGFEQGTVTAKGPQGGLHTEDIEFQIRLTTYYRERKDHDQAILILCKLDERNRDHVDFRAKKIKFMLGCAYSENGQADKAAETFQNLLDIHHRAGDDNLPTCQSVRFYLAKEYMGLSQYLPAIQLLEEHATIQYTIAGMHVTSQSIAADFLLGQAYFRTGNSAPAVRWFESSVSRMKEISPRDPILPRRKIVLARAYIFNGQKSTGIKLLESLVSDLDRRPREDPDLRAAQQQLVEAYCIAGQMEMGRALQQYLDESSNMRHSSDRENKMTEVDCTKDSQPS